MNTKVLTDKGQKKIQDIRIGDKVLAKDEKTGKQDYKTVQWLYERKVKEIYKLYIGKTVIETTDEHPFWVKGRGWVKAKDLKAGDQLEDADGRAVVLDKVERIIKKTIVYNFSVDKFHTYYVSNLGIFTHNMCGSTTTIYRKQDHPDSLRLSVDEAGNVSLKGDGKLYLNMSGDISHSRTFRGSGGHIVAFDMPTSYVRGILDAALPQRKPKGFKGSKSEWKRLFRTSPEISDPSKSPGLIGIPTNMLDEFMSNIIPGSGRIIKN
ncbi:polymorphic toxin-type HINT domain-containing protein [Laceyella putida]|uniref:Polymorphic toxin-type HINT domain-containing protein n=1 Tax=Laceyella putida TaxID=110101 RepID=A0ABW2RPU3_9BACL